MHSLFSKTSQFTLSATAFRGTHAVNDDVIIFIPDFPDRCFEQKLPAHQVHHQYLNSRQFNIAGNQIYAFFMVQYRFFDSSRQFVANRFLIIVTSRQFVVRFHFRLQYICEGILHFVWVAIAQTFCQTSLWIRVDQADSLSGHSKSNAKVDACGRLADTAFLICYTYNFAHLLLLPEICCWFNNNKGLRFNEPCRRFMSTSCSRTVAAFAVCIRSVFRLIVSELPSVSIRLVCAWLIASRKKKERYLPNMFWKISLCGLCSSTIVMRFLSVSAHMYSYEGKISMY